MISIYALRDPRDSSVRYVGKTEKSLALRLRRHVNRARSTPGCNKCASWIASLLAVGLCPMIELLASSDSASWQADERAWIRSMRDAGADLVNMTDGGAATHGHCHRDDTRARLSEIASAQFADPARRAAASEHAAAAWRDPAYRAQRLSGIRASAASPDFRLRQSEARRKLWATEAYRNKVVEAKRGAHTAGALSMWQRPGYREARLAARARRMEAAS